MLFEIYSPRLLTTQREYLAAMDYIDQLERNRAYPEAIDRARSLLEAARERLRYWDMTEEQIRALEEAGTAARTVQFFAPASGFIVEKMGCCIAVKGLSLSWPGARAYSNPGRSPSAWRPRECRRSPRASPPVRGL